MDREFIEEINLVSTLRQPETVDAKLHALLKEEVAKEVIGDRNTLPKTTTAKKQLAIDILTRKAGQQT